MFQKFIIFTLTVFFLLTESFGQSTQVKSIHFENNSYLIENIYITSLNDIGQRCASDTFSHLKIFAYSDTTGSKKYNKILSQKRAMEVFNYLTNKFHIDTNKIYVTWLGEEIDDAYDLHFPEAKVQQRCVDILAFFKTARD